ncbi:MAG: exodeoxyribonuclease VII small subunit [Actinomycetota bacterium]|nr:exodeoxyribonuclease VII small subunit [Actinomycetota bacterium]
MGDNLIEISFEAAIAEVEQILARISTSKSLDNLIDDVKRAKELLQYCESRVKSTESEIAELLSEEGQG